MSIVAAGFAPSAAFDGAPGGGSRLDQRVSRLGVGVPVIARGMPHRCGVHSPDLGAFFVKIAAREMGSAPETTMLDPFNDWRQGTALRVALHLPEPRAPNDDWVKRAALSGLEVIGYDVTILEDQSALIERTQADE